MRHQSTIPGLGHALASCVVAFSWPSCCALQYVDFILPFVDPISNSSQYGRENKRRDALMIELGGEEGVKARYSEQELLDMGDLSPFFRYAL